MASNKNFSSSLAFQDGQIAVFSVAGKDRSFSLLPALLSLFVWGRLHLQNEPVMKQSNILVIRGGAIGDFILTLPVVAALRAQFPSARLEVLGYPHIAGLAQAGGLAEAVASIEAGPLAGFFARDGILSPALQDFFAGFALIVSFLYDPDEVFQANVARCSKALFITGPHRPDETAGLHATTVFLKPLERLAIYDADPVPRLILAPRILSSLPLLALHPGSGSERKNWPETNWFAFLHALAAGTAWNFLLVGGEAEGARLERLAAAVPRQRLQLAFCFPLPVLAEKLAASHAFVGHDSGISHLAAALGLTTLVLWGDTVEAVWRPLGEHVSILHPPGGLASLAVETVLHETRRLLAASPA